MLSKGKGDLRHHIAPFFGTFLSLRDSEENSSFVEPKVMSNES